MGSGLSRENAALPFAVTTLTPSQRRALLPETANNNQQNEPSSSAVFPLPEQLLQQELQLQQQNQRSSRLARFLPRKRTITTTTSFEEDSDWWNPEKETLDDEDTQPNYESNTFEAMYGAENVANAQDTFPSPGTDAASTSVTSSQFSTFANSNHQRHQTGVAADVGTRIRNKPETTGQQYYPYAFAELNSYININLCSLGIVKLSPHIGLLPGTMSMQLCCNALTTLPTTLTDLRTLTHLDLSHNQITELPENIGDLNKLVEFRASNNLIKTIPPSIEKLTRLQVFAAARNKLTHLPGEMGALEALVELDLAGNVELESLPAEVGRLRYLRHVRLRGCLLMSVYTTSGPSNSAQSDQTDVPPSFTPSDEARSYLPSLKELSARSVMRRNPELYDMEWTTEAGANPVASSEPLPSTSVSPLPSPLSSATSTPKQRRFNKTSQNPAPSPPSRKAVANLGQWALRKSKSHSSLPSSSSSSIITTSSSRLQSTATTASPLPGRRRNKSSTQQLKIPPTLFTQLLSLPRCLITYLQSARRCTFCGGPYFDTYVSRFRFIARKGAESDEFTDISIAPAHENWIPLEYRLCARHWDTDEERLRAMFSPMPATALLRKGGPLASSRSSVGNAMDAANANDVVGLGNGVTPSSRFVAGESSVASSPGLSLRRSVSSFFSFGR